LFLESTQGESEGSLLLADFCFESKLEFHIFALDQLNQLL